MPWSEHGSCNTVVERESANMEALAALEMIVCLAVAYSIRGYAVWPVGLFVVFRGGRVLRRHMFASARGNP